MSYHSLPRVEWLPPCQPVVQWLPVEQTPVPVQATADPTAWMDLGRLEIEHDWTSQVTTVKATDWAERVLTVGLVVLGGYAAYKKLSSVARN